MLSTHVKIIYLILIIKNLINDHNVQCYCGYTYCDCSKLKIFTYEYDKIYIYYS